MHFFAGFWKRNWAGVFLVLGLTAALTGIFVGCTGTTTPSQQNDTTPPTVSVSAPAGGANVSGNVTVSADATDNVGVAGVQFLLDGSNLGAEVTTVPFSTTWNSTQSSNGAHAVSARARDAAGNTATSSMVNVTVSNAGLPLQLELAPAVTGFTTPLDMQAPSDGSGRLFVVEQGGKIKIIQSSGTVSATPFIDIATRPGFISGGETGLLGLAFHPNYSTNGKFYVNYTSNTGGLHTVIAEFTASPANSNTPNAASERILLAVNQPEPNHNGGGLAFGNDGFLYIALGDGGGGGDVHGTIGNGQDLNTLLGKILRLDVDSAPDPGLAYHIPSSNPFVNQTGRDEIWLFGLRNPFRFSFDHVTGNLWIGDVGQDSFEEVDLLTPTQGGANLGWRCREGAHDFNTSTANCATATFTDPIFDYSHANGDDSITGGYVYRGAGIPGLVGAYVFGDFISGRVWTLTKNAQGQWVRSTNPVLNMGGGNLSSFGQAQNGDLYVVRYSSGEVARIRQVGTP